jgi:hypothetical protein
MLSAKRVIAATALSLPILLGAPGMALAGGDHEDHDGKPCHSKKCKDDGQKIDQDQDASTEQSNHNKPEQYTWNVGSGEANSVSTNDQSNDASTEQNEAAWQED